MEITREIFWNVGRDVLVPMYTLALISIGVLIYGFLQRIFVYKHGAPLQRSDQFAARLFESLKKSILQLKVLDRSLAPGVVHAVFFWSFFLLFIGTTLVFIQVDIFEPFLDIRFLKGDFYKLFSLVLDLAGFIALIMLGYLFVRRFFTRLDSAADVIDYTCIYGFLFTIILSGFLLEGARMAVTEIDLHPELAVWSPIGLLTAKSLVGLDQAALKSLHTFTWWGHFILAAAFISAIPYTQLRHIFTSSANYIFSDSQIKGTIDTLDLESDDKKSFGVETVKDLTWKDILDSDACTHCNRCQDRCPAWNTDKPLSPKKIINHIQNCAFTSPDSNLIDIVGREELWACTTCRACQEVCPTSIEHISKILGMRRHLVLMQGEFPAPEVQTAVDQTEVNGNPLGMAFASRADWAAELQVKSLSEDPEVDLLYFVGCYASFERRNLLVAKSFIKICQAAGFKVGILGKEEKCCGEPVRQLGNEYLYQTLAQHNIEQIKKHKIQQIITTCPHCYITLDRNYRNMGLDLPVAHYTVFLKELHDQGKLPIQPTAFNCTYHDSCYIGRYADIFEQPRTLLHAAGGSIREMDSICQDSFCCGAGGGRILAEEKIGVRISETRVGMAQKQEPALWFPTAHSALPCLKTALKGHSLMMNWLSKT